MKSLRSNEGQITLDHRNSPGMGEAALAEAGLPLNAGRGYFQAPTYTCHHCQKLCVVRLPRNTELPYCAGCDHHICGTCGQRRAAGLACKPFKQLVDDYLEGIARGRAPETLVLPQ